MEAYHVTAPEVMWHDIADTFLGRDVIATAAAHLSIGFEIEDVGPAFDLEQLVLRPPTPLPTVNETEKEVLPNGLALSYANDLL